MKNAGDAAGTPKWTLAISAIQMVTTTFTDRIRWGLIMFPDKTMPACEQSPGSPYIPVGDANVGSIQGLLTQALNPSDPLYCANGPCETNIDTAVVQASADPALADKTRASFVLLLTDGKQSSGCGGGAADANTNAAIASMAALGTGTFVVGFGTEVEPMQLDMFAQLGGHPNPDPATDYYQASDGPSLQTALDSIASSVVGCEFQLGQAPEDIKELYVFIDSKPIARDEMHKDGWDYDATTMQVRFFGPSCDGLRDGTLVDIDIVYGCPEPTPE